MALLRQKFITIIRQLWTVILTALALIGITVWVCQFSR